MHAAIDKLSLRLSGIGRTANQRAAFGKFCLNAASFPSPERIEHRQHGRHQIHFIRRQFFGIDSPMINALVEPPSVMEPDIWAAARAALECLGEGGGPNIVKLFVAGSVRSGTPEMMVIPSSDGGGDYHAVFIPFNAPEAIEIPDSYDAFLSSLGRHTRRDMRRLRRNAEASGVVFDFRRAAIEPGSAERHALGRLAHPEAYQARHIDAYDTFLAAQENGFHATLRSAAGELLSCCAGLISDGAAFVLYQLNHKAYPKACLSLTNRSYTIERLVRDGVRELVLPGGGSGLLANFCHMRQSGELVLIRRSVLTMTKALAIAVLRPESSVSLAARTLFQARMFA